MYVRGCQVEVASWTRLVIKQARKSNHPPKQPCSLLSCSDIDIDNHAIHRRRTDKKKPFLLISTRPVFEDENAPYPLQNEEAASSSHDDFFRLSRPNYNIPPSFLPAKIAPILMSGVRRAFPSLPEFPATSVTFKRASASVSNADIKPKLTVASIVGRPKKHGAFPTRDRNSSSSGREQIAGAAHYCMFFEIFAPK